MPLGRISHDSLRQLKHQLPTRGEIYQQMLGTPETSGERQISKWWTKHHSLCYVHRCIERLHFQLSQRAYLNDSNQVRHLFLRYILDSYPILMCKDSWHLVLSSTLDFLMNLDVRLHQWKYFQGYTEIVVTTVVWVPVSIIHSCSDSSNTFTIREAIKHIQGSWAHGPFG